MKCGTDLKNDWVKTWILLFKNLVVRGEGGVYREEFFQVDEWANFRLVGEFLSKENPVNFCATPQLVLATIGNLFLILTWKLVNRGTTQTKKPSKWVAENPTEYSFFNKILWFMLSNAFCKLMRTSLLWTFDLDPTRCKWL